MQVNIVQLSDWRIPRKFILLWMEELTGLMQRKHKIKLRGQEISVVFVAESQIQKLNKDFRSKDKATDILSFSGFGDEDLGELVLCGDLVKRQAQEHGLSLKEELGYLLIHGVLHLLGYDHEKNETDAKKMFQLQDELFESLRYDHCGAAPKI